MSDILTRFTTKTIREQIIALLNSNGEMQFSKIKAAMGGKNDNTINRELKNLIDREPPVIIKKESGCYCLNRDHPQLEALLYTIGVIPKGTAYIKTILSQEEDNENIGYGLIVVSSHVDGFKEDLRKELNRDKRTQKLLDELYYGILDIKLDRIVQNKIKSGEIKKDEAKDYYEEIKKEVLEEGIVIHFLPVNKIPKP